MPSGRGPHRRGGGAIIPFGRIVQNTTEALLEPLTLLVSLDSNGTARGTLYEDAGDGYDYAEGDYLLTGYAAARDGDEVVVRVESADGERPRPTRTVNVTVLTDDGALEGSGSETDGITIDVSAGSAR